ncbi:MAG: response regulator [Nitrospirae bacterium]|nr:response regulator [Nitrospirota bacterium]
MPKILVADDSIAVRKVAERLLTEAGLGVTLAANGQEALAYLAKERPDVVVSDVIMPDKSGYEVCAFVRGHATLASTPVLLISGIVNHEVTKQAESCRADGVLKKPFQGTSLKDRVLELIAKRQDAAPASAADCTRRCTNLRRLKNSYGRNGLAPKSSPNGCPSPRSTLPGPRQVKCSWQPSTHVSTSFRRHSPRSNNKYQEFPSWKQH